MSNDHSHDYSEASKTRKSRREPRPEPEIVEDKGVFGKCSCGHEIYFYSDRAIRCSSCGKLYGTWKDKQPKE